MVKNSRSNKASLTSAQALNSRASKSGRETRPSSIRDTENEDENPLYEVFLDELADIYNAEKQLLKALPKMVKAAQSSDLKKAFESHLTETEEHVDRLEKVVSTLGATMKRKKCKAMEGLLAEGKDMMEEHRGEPTIDAVLIAAAQKVEHYEIASYGTVIAWAKECGSNDVVELLGSTLEEEKTADEKLTEIAEESANSRAA